MPVPRHDMEDVQTGEPALPDGTSVNRCAAPTSLHWDLAGMQTNLPMPPCVGAGTGQVCKQNFPCRFMSALSHGRCV